MTDSPYVSIIVPAYNERSSINSTLAAIVCYLEGRQLKFEIVVAIDGNDGTRELVRDVFHNDARVRVIGHAVRSGKGRGVREAVALCTGRFIGYTDADNKVEIGDFEKLEPFLREGYDVVFGSRGLTESLIDRPQPWFRRVGSSGFAWFMHAMVGLPEISDTQCGFKFFSRDAARRIFEAQQIDGYMFDIEILCLAQQMGFRMKEVPIRWRDDGDSRLDLVAGNIRNARDVFKIRASKRRVHRSPFSVEAQSQSLRE